MTTEPGSDPVPRRTLRGRLKRAVLIAVLGVAAALPAGADEVLRNGQWLPATIVRIEDGEMVYRPAAGGERSVPLDEVESLKLDDEAAFFEALEAFADEDYRKAQRMFGEIADQTRVQWVRHYAQYYLVQSLDQRSEPIEAAAVFAELARDGADPYFLTAPPLRSLEEINDDQRGRISAEIMDVIGDSEGATRQHLESYLRIVVGEDAMPDLSPVDPGPNGADAAAGDRTGSAVIMPAPLWRLLEAEDFDAERWECLTLLRDGKYEESIEALEPWLANPNDLPEKLFILARAQLALADASGERDDYLDAGLTFMRIAVHFDQTDKLAVPARLEVAYIHRMIDRVDLYNTLLKDSNLFLSFDGDPETYPQYYQRYYEIIGEPLPSDETQDDE